jgi:aspartyl-tRNA(Asn)/glutamyl-tRNA(Gln) amidotransferase subunit B
MEFEIQRQSELHSHGEEVVQQTMGWDEYRQITVPQRSKEEEDDYRYFPEPDLPPLVVSEAWIEEIRAALPELPQAKLARFQSQYDLNAYDADILVAEKETADYFEAVIENTPDIDPKSVANWITGELFGLMNQAGESLSNLKVSPQALGELLTMLAKSRINATTAKSVLAEMFEHGKSAQEIVDGKGLAQISDSDQIATTVAHLLAANPDQVKRYHEGKESLANWFFGQVMREMKGQANPQVVKSELQKQLSQGK